MAVLFFGTISYIHISLQYSVYFLIFLLNCVMCSGAYILSLFIYLIIFANPQLPSPLIFSTVPRFLRSTGWIYYTLPIPYCPVFLILQAWFQLIYLCLWFPLINMFLVWLFTFPSLSYFLLAIVFIRWECFFVDKTPMKSFTKNNCNLCME